jgi:hypothetical protein
MCESKLIEAVKNDEIKNLEILLKDGEDIEQKDDYGWTALNWAAGHGNTEVIKKLLLAGANITNTGTDNRNPYQIALAAAQVEAASILKQAQETAIAEKIKRAGKPYCKAYPISELRQFSSWHELLPGCVNEEIVFLHQDLSATRSVFHGKDVIFDTNSTAWVVFCKNELAFRVMSELEIASRYAENNSCAVNLA